MSSVNRIIAVLAMLQLSLYCIGGSNAATYSHVRMSDICNVTRQSVCDRGTVNGHWNVGTTGSLGFTEWFDKREIVLKGIPFKLSEGVRDALSGTSKSKESFEIPCLAGKVIYLLGTGSQLTRELGYDGDYCDDLSRFNIEAVYSDGTTEEIFPINILSGQPRWYNFTNSESSVAAFPMKETEAAFTEAPQTGNLSIYAVLPSKPALLKTLYFNDNDTPGDYTVFAVTVSDVVPPELTHFIKDGPRRMHPRPIAARQVSCEVQNEGEFNLCDISGFCNQNIGMCFDSGYGVGRGIITGLSTTFTGDKATYDGIPFRVASGEKNVVSTSKKGLESCSILLNQRAEKVYMLLALIADVVSFDIPNDCVNDPYYFDVQVIYEDGSSDTYFPKAVADGEYKVIAATKEREFRTYVLEPLQKKEIREIRLNDKMDMGDFVLAGLTLSSERSGFYMPSAVVTKWREEPAFSSPSINQSGSIISLENSYTKIALSTDGGLKLTSLINKYANQEMIRGSRIGSLFEIYDTGDRNKRYTNADFTVAAVRVDNNAGQSSVSFELEPNDGLPFKVLLGFTIDGTPECRYSCNVLNTSDSDREFKIHQFLTNIVIGDAANTYYFYPPPRGTVDNRPLKIRKMYGGSNYLQFMDVFNPDLGAGVYVRPDDTWGQGKIISFWKYGVAAGTIDDKWANYAEQFVPALDVNIDAGCYVGYEYWDRIAGAGEKTEIPEMIIGMHTGDWHVPFQNYRNWIEKNFTRREEPEWLKKAFSISFSHPAGLRDQNNKYCFWVERGQDIFEPMIWWNDPGVAYTGGTNEYYYREDWGGEEAFRAAVSDAAKRGTQVVAYVEGIHFQAQFGPGDNTKRLQSTSCIVTKDGKPMFANGMGNMCPGSSEWQDYLASVAARLVRDIGIKGIYIDSTSQCPAFGCYDPRHNHKYPGQTWVHDTAELFRKVSAAMREVDPEAVLYSEAPCADIATCEMDGSWLSFWDFPPESPRRFGNPLLIDVQPFMFRNKKMWCLPEGIFNEVSAREAFFSGVALPLVTTMDVAPTSLSPYHKYMHPAIGRMADILRDNYKIYTSENAEPYIQSYIHWVFVNKFGSGRDVIYNVLNNNYITVRGTMFEVDGPGEYKDLLSGKPAPVVKKGSRYFVSFELGPKGIAAIKRIR